jgi:ATP-dependent Clp protease ATP-binding subunit ClpB
MRLDRLTTKSHEALRSALDAATRRGNPELIPEHLLVAILEQDGGVGGALVERAGAQARALARDLGERVASLPQVSGGAEPSFGRRFTPLVSQAESEAKALKDEYVSVKPVSRSATTSASTISHGLSVSFSTYSHMARSAGESSACRKSIFNQRTNSASFVRRRRPRP